MQLYKFAYLQNCYKNQVIKDIYYSFLKTNYIKKQKYLKKKLLYNKIIILNICFFIYALYIYNNLKNYKMKKNF